MKKKILCIVLLSIISILMNSNCNSLGSKLKIKAENQASIDRTNEPVVINCDIVNNVFSNEQLKYIKVTGEDNREIPVQIDDLNLDGQYDEIVFVSDFLPNQIKEYTLTIDKETGSTNLRYKPLVNAQMAIKNGGTFQPKKEIKVPGGDLWIDAEHHGPAWESELIGYRIYFDKKSAIDIYGKNKYQIELNKSRWYTSPELLEQGLGHDIFYVGNSIGLGSIRLWDGQKDIMLDPVKSRDARIIADGPVRTIVEMKAVGLQTGQEVIDLTSRFTMYAGRRDMSHEVISTKTDATTLCTGMTIMNDSLYDSNISKKIFTQWGYSAPDIKKPGQQEQIAMAIIIKEGKVVAAEKTDESYLIVFDNNEINYTYHIISAWGGEVESFNSYSNFKNFVNNIEKSINNEIVVRNFN